MSDHPHAGKLIEPADDIFTKGEIGDWAFDEGEKHIFICLPPLGIDKIAALPIRGRASEKTAWDWDGSRNAPTLSPSILDFKTGWHGYLKAGKLEGV